MGISFLLLILLSGDVQHVSKVRLKAEFAPREPLVIVAKTGDIYYQDYWGNSVTKLDKNGEIVYKLSGPGNGPGEVNKPECLTLFDNETRFLVLHSQMTLSMYDAKTGRFLKNVKRPYLATRIMQWDDNSILALKDPGAYFAYGFEVLNVKTGETGGEWFKLEAQRTNIVSSNMALAMLENHVLYYQSGSLPEAYVVKPFTDKAHIWALRPPPGYIEPPKEPLPEKDRYSREKVDAYYNSFTMVQSFKILGEKHFLVCWKNTDGTYYYQLYDIKTETLLTENLPLKGRMISSTGHRVHTLERIDPDNLDSETLEIVHTYEIGR